MNLMEALPSTLWGYTNCVRAQLWGQRGILSHYLKNCRSVFHSKAGPHPPASSIPTLISIIIHCQVFFQKETTTDPVQNAFWRRQAVERAGAVDSCPPKGIIAGRARRFASSSSLVLGPFRSGARGSSVYKERPAEKHQVETGPGSGFKVTNRIQVSIGQGQTNEATECRASLLFRM